MSGERDRSAALPPGAPAPVGEFPRPKPTLLAAAIADSVAEAIATGHAAPGEFQRPVSDRQSRKAAKVASSGG